LGGLSAHPRRRPGLGASAVTGNVPGARPPLQP
jgi:hypothetical protein